MENVVEMGWPDGKHFDIGVVVGRFQVPYIHASHKYILDSVQENHKYMLIMIGVSPVYGTRSDPLDYLTRMEMLRCLYPKAIVVPIFDNPSDILWSDTLDRQISSLFPNYTARLYGGRGSFISHYKGTYSTFETPKTSDLSGTELRKAVDIPIDDPMFRQGVIYGAMKKAFPTIALCADMALMDGEKVLLGSKKADNGLLRFPGGFLDLNDDNFETTAKRELREETSLLAEDVQYIGSFKLKDWRYSGENEALYTAFYRGCYTFGTAKAQDDLDTVEWIDINNIDLQYIMPNHRPLIGELKLNHIGRTNV